MSKYTHAFLANAVGSMVAATGRTVAPLAHDVTIVCGVTNEIASKAAARSTTTPSS